MAYENFRNIKCEKKKTMHPRMLEIVGIQSTSPKNILPWNIDYFELKALEKQ